MKNSSFSTTVPQIPPTQEWTLTARWVFPVDQPPLEGGMLSLRGEHIVGVRPKGQRTADVDLGNVALLPGFVNAHTHLDLSGLRDNPPGDKFTDWLRGVVDHRQLLSTADTLAHIRAGLEECVRFGTTLVGDISHGGLSWHVLANGPIRAVVFYELLGLSQERAEQAETEARQWLQARRPSATCRPGLSPHAPFSVRRSLFEAVANLARQRPSTPLAVHLAESPAEMALLRHREGSFVGFLDERGVWDLDGLVSEPDEVVKILSGLPAVSFIHGNFLDPHSFPAGDGTIVYCPRTHAAFAHPTHPFREFLQRGVRVALGTDSRASSPDLDLLAEARFLHRIHLDVDRASLLRMATLSGAEALGWQEATGSLTPGKSADLVVLPLPAAHPADPHELLFASSLPVQAVLWRGQWVHGTDQRPPPS